MIINHNILCNIIIGNKAEFVMYGQTIYTRIYIKSYKKFFCVRFLHKIECEIKFSELNCYIEYVYICMPAISNLQNMTDLSEYE